MPSHQKFIVAAVILGVVLVVVLIVSAAVHANRKRLAALAALLGARGFTFMPKPDAKPAADALSRAGAFRTLRTGEKGVKWVGHGVIGGRPATLLEHLYTTHSGKNTQFHYRLIVAVECAPAWPPLTLSGEHVFHRLGEWLAGAGVLSESLGLRDIKVESEEFNKRWRVKSVSEDFAILFLSPKVQAWGMSLPRHAELHVADGALCVSAALAGNAKSLPPLLDAAESLLAILPPELEHYAPA